MTSIPDESFNLDHPKNINSTSLKHLSSNSTEFYQVKNLFDYGWRHPDKKKPKVVRIFRILTNASAYESYRASIVSASSADVSFTRYGANEQLLFHGTNRHCTLGEEEKETNLCYRPECNLCCIISGSFEVSMAGSKHKFRRFGVGIYTTSCSSKADDYSQNGDENCQFKAVLVNRVVVGNPYTLRTNATQLTQAPYGYHSVRGEPGDQLNYEETVVYDNDAIRPAYLVIYGNKPPTSPLKSRIFGLFSTSLA
ncbi:ADP-ribosylation [Crepidotus variabilis]|uniref:Poly [ADP-ribose] polymerase n=1 Tax=Crepidotus variabilis TaxID=179855 RepID=A0A9P6ER90_9AGAR|nr:ADP-ribosylation [Crepidotus variabilis]